MRLPTPRRRRLATRTEPKHCLPLGQWLRSLIAIDSAREVEHGANDGESEPEVHGRHAGLASIPRMLARISSTVACVMPCFLPTVSAAAAAFLR